MRKLFLLVLIFCFGFTPCLSASTFVLIDGDTPKVQVWYGWNEPVPYGAGWYEYLGPEWRTYKAEVTWSGTNNQDVRISLFTDSQEYLTGYRFHPTTANLIGVADLGIDLNRDGTWDTMVALVDHGTIPTLPFNTFFPNPPGSAKTADTFVKGNVYTMTDWFYSLADVGYYTNGYGGKYDEADPKDIPVWGRFGTLLASGSVTFTNISTSSPMYRIDIDLPGVNADGSWNNFNLFWATGLCGNDVLTGNVNVPLPGAVLLLGAGVARLLASARRRPFI